jgi:hypothetical protein
VSAAQELLGVLKDARPSQRYEPRPKPAPKPERVTSLYGEAMPNWVAVELPALGGDACILTKLREPRVAIGEVSKRDHDAIYRVDCKHCDQPRAQQLMDRTFAGGETWSVLPCTSCRGTR